MRIAIPVTKGLLDAHFGHCSAFAFIDVDTQEKQVLTTRIVDAPPHVPGLLPGWLAKQGANLVLAGGMGNKAIQLLKEQGMDVLVGVPQSDPESLARDYLKGEIGPGLNACDH